jgi:DNA adenine methylase
MTDDDHRALLDALCAHPGPVVLSGYACPLYDDRLGGWQRQEIAATAEGGRARTEIVWRNARAAVPRLFD